MGGTLALLMVAEAAVMLASTSQALALPSRHNTAAPSKTSSTRPLTAPDLASAIATARLRGRKVEVLDERTDRSTTWANPRGTLTTDSYAAPVRFRRGGAWVNVDTTLRAASGGAVAPKAQPQGLVLAPGGRKASLAAEGTGAHRVAVGWKGPLPRPRLKGSTATYANVSPGTDVTVQATRTGFEENVVLRARPSAGYQVVVPISAKGLTAKQAKNGSITFTDSHGKVAGTIPAPVMWDARVDPASLEHTHRARVKMTMSQSGDTVDLALTPDAKFLADPRTSYPVTVDPSTSLSSVLDTFVENTDSTAEYTSTDLKLGTYDAGTDVARSFLQFPVSQLVNAHVLSSSLNLYEYWSADCAPASWELWQTGAASTSTVWSNQPSWTTKYVTTTQTKGYPSSCGGSVPEGWVSVDPSSFLQYAGDHGYTYANLGLRATDETDSGSWKRFYSANASSDVPYLSVTYNSYPMTSAPTVAPGVSSASGATTTLYTNTATPQLQATVTDADGGNVMAQWNVYDTTGGVNTQVISHLNGSWTASGGTSSASVPSGKLVDGHTYTAWPWGYDGSLWARQTVPSGLVFTVDTTRPNAPSVASTDYPSNGWAKGAGQSGGFTLTPPAGGTGTAGVVWQLDSGEQTFVATTGAAVTAQVTPAADGPHTLTVYTRDLAGNLSDAATYKFDAGAGAITSPKDGGRSARRATLTAAGPSTAQSVRLQYRRAGADGWSDIPVAQVTNGGSVLSAWPVTMSNGVSPDLVWDVAATLGDDGSVQVRGHFTDSSGSGYDSSAVTFTLDRNSTDAATEQMGPGSVNLSTGDFALSATDASGLGLTLARSASSRNPTGGAPTGQAAPFGPQWTLGELSDTASTGYTEIRPVTSNAVQLVTSDGSEVAFTKNGSGTWIPEPGAEDYSLAYSSSADQYTLTDTDGTVTVFAKSDANAGVWTISSTAPSGSGNTTRYRFDTVTSGGTTTVRLARMVAPTSAISDLNASCVTPSTPGTGCRALQFDYATSTTATGTTTGTFGNYAGRVASVTRWAIDPATGTETATAVAQYSYDTNGMLREEWDPHISPHLVTAYTYDSAGRITTLTPPGQLPWNFDYGTAGTDGDTNAGRLLGVSRATLTPGSASTTNGTATTKVVYDVPLTTGSGGPYDMGGSDVATWAQSDRPTDATAVFPTDQVPSSNTGSGNLTSGDYSRATVHYLDVNGREVNTAQPGGHITTTEYDTSGNTVRELTAGNRELALSAGSNSELNALGLASATTAQRAAQLSSLDIYDSTGQQEKDTYGPLHRVILEHALAASGTSAALPAGSVVAARTHTHNTFDENRPTDGSAKVSNQITTAVVGAAVTGYAADADTHTSKTYYDWTLGKPIKTVTDPSGLAITTLTGYNTAGQVTSSSQPSSNGSDAATTITTYYTAGGSAPCGGHPEWADMACRTAPAADITGGGSNPAQRVTSTTTYTASGLPRQVTDTANGVTRTTTTTYDSADRTIQTAVSGGSGQAVQTTTVSYSSGTGLAAGASTPDGKAVAQTYDQLGRQMSYTDADGNTATTQYDSLNRPIKISDSAPSTLTYTYDTAKDPRGVVTSETDTNAGTFSATYDANGTLATESLPGSVTLATTTDEAGQNASRTYTGASGNVLLSDQAGHSAGGQEAGRALSTSGGLGVDDTYTYDDDSRLTHTNETVIQGQAQSCTARTYAFDQDTNRKSLTTSTGATTTDGTTPSCPTSGGTTTSHTYDSADRLVDGGYAYDAFGRITGEPGDITTAYYVNDLARQQTSASQRTTWQLDPAGRFHSSTTETNASGTWTQTASRTSHYDGPSDRPAWTVENTSTGAYTRNVPDLGGALGATYSSSNGDVILQLTDLHGDVTMTLPTNDANTAVLVMATDEYGNSVAGAGSARYRWLGAKERSGETPTGDIMMGVRLYNPVNARFLSTDPVPGGSANAYDYAAQDPVNKFDLDGSMIRCGENRTGDQCSNATTPWYYEGRYTHITGWKPSFYSSMPAHVRAIFETLEASFMAGVYVEGAYWRYDYHYSSYWRYYHGRVQHKTAHWSLYADQPRLKVWINFFGDYTITGYWNDHKYD